MLRQRYRLVEQRLVFDHAAGLEPAARRQDRLRLGVIDAGGELARGKAAEHHRMHRADARAGEHAEHGLRDHRHVEHDAVALLDAEVAQQRRQHLHLGEQEIVGDDAFDSCERRIVDDRRLRTAAAHHMAVDRVPAGVADGVREPAAVDAGVGIENFLRRLVPVDIARRRRPEFLPGRAASARIRRDIGWSACPPRFAPGRFYAGHVEWHCDPASGLEAQERYSCRGRSLPLRGARVAPAAPSSLNSQDRHALNRVAYRERAPISASLHSDVRNPSLKMSVVTDPLVLPARNPGDHAARARQRRLLRHRHDVDTADGAGRSRRCRRPPSCSRS